LSVAGEAVLQREEESHSVLKAVNIIASSKWFVSNKVLLQDSKKTI